MTDRELMQMALEALEEFCEHQTMLRPIEKRDALRERLAQPEQEPVAYVDHRIHGWPDCFVMDAEPPHTSPLYTTPPRREWVGLTEQEPKLSCGVDYDDGLLTVSVVHGHADGSMEVIHCEQIAMPIKAQPEPDNDFQERLARTIEAMPFGDTARSFATFVREFK